MTEEYAIAFSEVLNIINTSAEKDQIPESFKKLLYDNSKKDYNPNFDPATPIKDLKLRKETKWILSLIYLSYLADSEQKVEFTNILKDNFDKYSQEQKDKYDVYKIFEEESKKREQARLEAIQEAEKKAEIDTNQNNMVQYKRISIFQKILNKIKSLFGGKNNE